MYKLQKTKLNDLIVSLSKKYPVLAPVRTDVVRFQEVSDASEIDLTENAYVPLKQFFFPQREALFQFSGNDIKVPTEEVGPRVFFGVRRCDLNAVAHQDIVYLKDVWNPYYEARRKNAIFIGYHCAKPANPNCFCGSMDLKDCQDLMFVERPDYFLVDVGSPQGEKLAQELSGLFQKTDEALRPEDKKTPDAEKLATTQIAQFYDNPEWETGVKWCLSCAACTTLCPTCYCHEICDTVESGDTSKGQRDRCWSSCQLKEFSRIAGDFVFRESRSERFRFRIYHQIEYFRERYGVTMCVGCGRCISFCPTKIDWVRIVNRMVGNG